MELITENIKLGPGTNTRHAENLTEDKLAQLFNGQTWLLSYGDDFTGDLDLFRTAVRKRAEKRGVTISTRKKNADSFYVRADVSPVAEAAARVAKSTEKVKAATKRVRQARAQLEAAGLPVRRSSGEAVVSLVSETPDELKKRRKREAQARYRAKLKAADKSA